jgi:hypothetical protein
MIEEDNAQIIAEDNSFALCVMGQLFVIFNVLKTHKGTFFVFRLCSQRADLKL